MAIGKRLIRLFQTSCLKLKFFRGKNLCPYQSTWGDKGPRKCQSIFIVVWGGGGRLLHCNCLK